MSFFVRARVVFTAVIPSSSKTNDSRLLCAGTIIFPIIAGPILIEACNEDVLSVDADLIFTFRMEPFDGLSVMAITVIRLPRPPLMGVDSSSSTRAILTACSSSWILGWRLAK